jgi:hypothetical protein
MDELLKLGLMFLTESRGGQRGGASAGRVTTAALCMGLAIVAITAGVACGIAALWIYLIPIIGPAGAALSAAAVFLITGGVLMLVARNLFRTPPRAAIEDADAEPLAEELLGVLREGIERHKGASLLAALVAGLAAGSANR